VSQDRLLVEQKPKKFNIYLAIYPSGGTNKNTHNSK